MTTSSENVVNDGKQKQPEEEEQLLLQEEDTAEAESPSEVVEDVVMTDATTVDEKMVEEAAPEEEETVPAVEEETPASTEDEDSAASEEAFKKVEEEVFVEEEAPPAVVEEEEKIVPPLVEESATPPDEDEEEEKVVSVPMEEEEKKKVVVPPPPVPVVKKPVAAASASMGVPASPPSVTKESSSNAVDGETTTASGWEQVRALMEKNFLTKARTPGATIAEFFSPVLLCSVLWFAYTMADIESYPSKMFHAIRVDLPFFWDNGYVENEYEDFEFGRRRRMTKMTGMDAQGAGLEAVDYGLEEGEEEASKWTWSRLLKTVEGDFMEDLEPGEDMGMITDLFMFNHARNLKTSFEMNMDDGEMSVGQSFTDDDQKEPWEWVGDTAQDVLDAAEDAWNSPEKDEALEWMEDAAQQAWDDIKANTVDKVDWDEVVDEIKDNFSEIWEDAKDYVFIQSGRSASRRLNQLRLRLKDFLRRPIVTPTFGQYVWASKMLSSFINVKRTLPRVLVDSSYGRQWGNLLTLGTIHLSPSGHPMTQKFLDYLDRQYPGAKTQVMIRTHNSSETALNYVMDHLDDERTWAMIDLEQLADGTDESVKGGSFTIRLNYTTVPNTALIENYVAMGLSTRFQRYYLSGYLTLQRTVNDFIMDNDGCNPHVDPFYSMPMPTAQYEQNVFFLHVGYLLGLVLVMALLYPTSRLIQSLVEERETRMKETLLILGVRPWAHTTSWVLSTLVNFAFITMLMALVLRKIMAHQSFMMIWIWMGLFSMSAMAFCFFLSSFFSKAKLAAVIGPMALFASLLPRFLFFGTNRYEAIGGKYLASILPGTALAFGADIVGDYEYGEQPVADSMWVGAYSFGTSLSFLWFNTLFYMTLAWYTEQVIPREYGAAPRPWYFPLLWLNPMTWLSCFHSSDRTLASDSDSESEDDMSVLTSNDKTPRALDGNDSVEPVNDPALVPRVFVKDLVKIYNKKQVKPSVNHLNLTMYESQITALLGHNGAGKTTTVSVMTGLFPPTTGDVSIYGNSIVKDLAKARQSIGICPQHNVLFGSLTVMEHMKFFSKIKGMSFDEQDLKDRCFELGLTQDQLRTTAAALSGGNKRKLSVAIALCGNPKFLILDEPTSAMDPTARRRTWQVLRKKRAGRVTMLTTHFMDEAEHLSDRVAVVKEGELQCCGSPLFLKDRYNLGWNLTVVMEKPAECDGVEDEYATTQLRVANFLQQYVPGAKLVRRSGRELTFCLPKGSEDLFPECFDAFEQQAKDLGVSTYGVENASFEEVFLLLAEKEKNGSGDVSKEDVASIAETGSVLTDNKISRLSISDNESVASSKRSGLSGQSGDTDDSEDSDESVVNVNTKIDTLKLKDWQQYKGMSPIRQICLLYWKRWAVQKRDGKGAFFAILVPVVLIALVICVLTADIIVAGPAIEMSPALYKDAYSTSNAATTQVLVGGGNRVHDDTSVHTEFLFMDAGLTHDYPNAQFMRLDNLGTSELSKYLLDTYNDHDHPTRFGAFSIDDNVEVQINLNFTSIYDQINYYSRKRKSHGSIRLRDQQIDIMEVLGLTGNNGRLYWRKSVAELEEEFYAWSGIDPHFKVRTRDLYNLTQEALNTIMSSSNKELADIRSQYVEEVRNATDELYSNVMTFVQSQHVRDLQSNSTKIYEDFMDGAQKIIDNSAQMEKDFERMLKKFVKVGFYRVNETMPEAGRTVFEWQGNNLENVTRDFVENLYTLGDDPNSETLGVYNLTQKLYDEVRELVDYNLEIFNSYNDNKNYTFESIEQAVYEAVRAQDNEFNRDVIIRQMSDLMSGVVELYGHEGIDAVDTITNATKWVDNRLNDYSNGNLTRIPPRVFVAPMILIDYVLGQWDVETISPDEAFGYLSEALGGNRRKKDGFISFRAKDIIVDMGKLEIDFRNVFVTSGHGTHLELDKAFSLQFSIDALKDMVPSTTTNIEFRFYIPSKTSLLHNSSSPHAVAAFNQAYMEHRYKQCVGDVRGQARLVSVNHPLPLTAKQSLEIKIMLSVLAGLFILIPFCYIPATFIVFIVRERVSKSKHLQLVSGVNLTAYWIAHYLWDLTLYFLLTMCTMLVFAMYGNSAQVFIGSWDAALSAFCLVFGYGMSSLPFSYLLSRKFSNSSTAQISIAGIGGVTGFGTVIAYVTMINLEKTRDLAQALQPWFRLFPAYNVGEGFMFMCTSFWEREILGIEKYPLDWEVTGRSIFYLFLLAAPYSFLVLVFEYTSDGGAGGYLGRGLRAISHQWTKFMLKRHGIEMSNGEEGSDYSRLSDENKLSDDEDVVRERQHVMKNSEELRHTAPVVLNNLWKIYPPSVGIVGANMAKLRTFLSSIFCFCMKGSTIREVEDGEQKTFVPKQAVRGVSTAINKGETYALLGANGAGKTTTMGMLTGDITSTNGNAYIAGHNATGGTIDGVTEARKNIGFCPQKDPLLDLMTGRETLTMFARLRGVPPKEVDSLVNELLERLTLTPHADKVTRAYSGGNKRKLSLGLALIGDPKVLLIDESSSGLDPLAKRKMWDLIEEAARHRSVILTTHSMQEAEALCTRVAIMVKGQYVCLGSVQHLKTKYLDGYSVDMFCNSSATEADVDNVVARVLQALPDCSVSERHGRFMRFEVKNVSSLGLGTCFRRLQELKNEAELHVENYSVSQCSLEHVFVKLVNTDDNNPRDDDLEHGEDWATTL